MTSGFHLASDIKRTGFWSTVHEARADLTMVLSCIYLVIVGAGSWSVDRQMEGQVVMVRARLGSSTAFNFVLTMGVVNLFSDMTYEGGGAINGQFMASLGASAAVVSITAGLGELLRYTLRSVSGYVADRTGRYWLVTFFGYAINLLAVPAMVLAGNWQVAALLILAERIGRALRKPTVEGERNLAFGLFYSGYGVGWLIGSIAAGLLYE